MQDELDAVATTSDARTEELEKVTIKPKATGLTVQVLTLVWSPV